MKHKLDIDNIAFYKVDDFLKDNNFLRYVLGDAPYMQPEWERLLMEHPELSHYYNEAEKILVEDEDGINEQFDITQIKESIIKHLF